MKVYMDPKETIIINLEEVKRISKYDPKTLMIWFKDGDFKEISFADKEQRDNELRLIFHEMHN